MEIVLGIEGLCFLAYDGRDYLLNVNGSYASTTIRLTHKEAAAFEREGEPYIEQLARHLSSSSSAASARRVPDSIPPSLTRAWRIERGLPVYDAASNSWKVLGKDDDGDS